MTSYQHASALVYDRAMTTPILTAALNAKLRRNPRAIQRRQGGGGAEKAPHNFVAQAPKKKAGAPLGNRNAARRDPETVERLAQLDVLVRQSKALAHMARATARDTNVRCNVLAALLAEPRNV